MVFCSVDCWEAHLPLVRHREAYALDEHAPSQAAWEKSQAEEAQASEARATRAEAAADKPKRRTIAPSGMALSDDYPKDILIVASKLKRYVKERAGMNTSDGVMKILSERVRDLCDRAIVEARKDGRKTVMDRDF